MRRCWKRLHKARHGFRVNALGHIEGTGSPLEISIKDTFGKRKPTQVRSLTVDGKEIVITGKFARTARLADEWYDDVSHPEVIIAALKKADADIDIFTFWQRLPDTTPKYQERYTERESIAALPIKSFDHWRKNQLNTKSRNLLKKSEKLGVTIRQSEFDDKFIDGMSAIFNETPIRQGRRFWHYGKSAATVKRDFSRFLFREDIFGAYYKDELIGFIFLAYAGKYAMLGQIISKIGHRDKSPNNALIAKAVEVCEQKGLPYLVYALWTTGTLGHFKEQNGFERFDLPRYYVPLTIKGSVVLRLRLHHGLKGILPAGLRRYLVNLRKHWYSRRGTQSHLRG